jgi:hypothetical protein
MKFPFSSSPDDALLWIIRCAVHLEREIFNLPRDRIVNFDRGQSEPQPKTIFYRFSVSSPARFQIRSQSLLEKCFHQEIDFVIILREAIQWFSNHNILQMKCDEHRSHFILSDLQQFHLGFRNVRAVIPTFLD